MKWSPWLRSVESGNWLKLSSCLLLSFIGMLKYETLMPFFSMAVELFLIIIVHFNFILVINDTDKWF